MQLSSLDEMKAWMSVSAAVVDRLRRRRAMFRRWKKAVLVIWLTWGRKERVGSTGSTEVKEDEDIEGASVRG